jgi:acetyl-CoA carboxylase carboxyltransferase component
MQLCDAFDLPLVMLVDTPGMMVGPDVEATALVRHCNRLFVTGANVTVPTVAVVLRKAYGLGAQAMMGGSSKAPLACLAWPTSEFGGMGLEGAVRLGYRHELDATADEAERQRLFDELVTRAYDVGKGISVASYFEIDDVIDPAETRRVLITLLDAAPPPSPRPGKKRPNIDTW